MKLLSRLLFASMFALPAASHADDVAVADVDQLKRALSEVAPGVPITQISESPIQGLYEVVVGPQVVYMTKDARYLIQGDLVDFKTKENYTERARSGIRLSKIEQFGEDKMVVYAPKKVKHTVTIVTDINCPYCRRLHDEIDEYLSNGIKVRYIFMPLKGEDDYDTTVSVWCSKDQNKALNAAKAGISVEKKSCDNPIREHLQLARELGVRGTPAIILESGEMLPGYVPVKKLVAQLQLP